MKMIRINRSPASAVQEPRPAATGGWPARPRDRIAEVCRPWGLREIGPCHRGEACWCRFPGSVRLERFASRGRTCSG